MIHDVILPKLGLTMEEGTIVRWWKSPGETVEPGDVLFEVESDKSIQEVEAGVAGVLVEILVEEGVAAPVAAPVARIRLAGHQEEEPTLSADRSRTTAEGPALSVDAGPALSVDAGLALSVDAGPAAVEAVAPAGPQPSEKETPGAPPDGGRFVSWRARRIASEHGLELAGLPEGSGPGGRLIERDILAFLEKAPPPAPADWLELTTAQRVAAERMAYSFSTAPHFYLTVEANAGRLLAYRQEVQARLEAGGGVRLTITDLLIRAAALALVAHPRLNAAWVDGRVRLNREIHLGLATATGQGLLVPVIRSAAQKSLVEIARERLHLAEKARANRLLPDELNGGTFTLTNLGMYGIDTFQAILNPPQSAILAVGRIKERPFASGGLLGVKPTCFLTLSCDHRVVDGLAGSAFLQRFVELIEDPSQL